jgi:hypothetical protein
VFDPPGLNDWAPVMRDMAAALAETLPSLGT